MAVSQHRSSQSSMISSISNSTTPSTSNSDEENVCRKSLFDIIDFILIIL